MKINIFGSTGVIGKKTLNIIKTSFPNIKVNLLCANSNYKTLIHQANIFKPKFLYLNETNNIPKLKSKIDKKIKVFNFFKNNSNLNNINKVILTASGGPFYKKKFHTLTNVSFKSAIKHPKWKMGYKNSIDSATLVNKCLEVIEAHYLFNLPFNKIKVLIHPQAIIHSIIEYQNYTTNMNLFKNDMAIPIINFLMQTNRSYSNFTKNLYFNSYSNFNFEDIKNDIFPIYKYFIRLDKTNPANLIKFNVGNEYAVNLYKNNLINYTDIYKIIKKVCSLNLYSSLNNIKDIIEYHEELENYISSIFKNSF